MCSRGEFRKLKSPRGGKVFDAVSLFKFFEYAKKDFGGGERIAARAVSTDDRN